MLPAAERASREVQRVDVKRDLSRTACASKLCLEKRHIPRCTMRNQYRPLQKLEDLCRELLERRCTDEILASDTVDVNIAHGLVFRTLGAHERVEAIDHRLPDDSLD